jgi:hypothetical protein
MVPALRLLNRPQIDGNVFGSEMAPESESSGLGSSIPSALGISEILWLDLGQLDLRTRDEHHGNICIAWVLVSRLC